MNIDEEKNKPNENKLSFNQQTCNFVHWISLLEIYCIDIFNEFWTFTYFSNLWRDRRIFDKSSLQEINFGFLDSYDLKNNISSNPMH